MLYRLRRCFGRPRCLCVSYAWHGALRDVYPRPFWIDRIVLAQRVRREVGMPIPPPPQSRRLTFDFFPLFLIVPVARPHGETSPLDRVESGASGAAGAELRWGQKQRSATDTPNLASGPCTGAIRTRRAHSSRSETPRVAFVPRVAHMSLAIAAMAGLPMTTTAIGCK